MPPKVNIRQLRAFITVAEHQSFTKASEILRVSQPTLTTAIVQLEQALSLRLLDRDTRSVTLTESGTSFLSGAKNLIDNFDALMSQTKRTSNLESGKVMVSSLPSFAATIVSQSISKFRTDYPGITVHLYDGIDLDVADRVLRWHADFGIGGRPFSYPGLDFDPLMIESFFVIFRRDHSFASQNCVTMSEVAKERLIVQNHRTGIQEVIEKAFAKEEHRVNVFCEAEQLSTVKSLVEAGLGISIVNSTCLPIFVNENIMAREIANCGIAREIGIITRKDGVLSPAASCFQRIVRAAMLRKSADKI